LIPSVSNIRIYPIKSFDPVELDEVTIGKSSLLHDREFSMFKNDGKYVSGKTTPKVNKLRAYYDLENYSVTFNEEGKNIFQTFSLNEDNCDLNKFLTDFFGYSVSVKQNKNGRFQDVPDFGGVTLVSDASLKLLTYYFSEISLKQMRFRFRANIVISNTEAFWEDNLFDVPGSVIEFKINNVTLYGISPRERCIVPTRDSMTGEMYPRFTKKFVEARKETIPEWSPLSEYSHFYYLCVDTFIPDSETGKVIRLGDELKIIGKKDLSLLSI
jgi:uncharacterized protein YcbX